MGHISYYPVNRDVLNGNCVERLNDKSVRARFGIVDISDLLVFVVDERGYVIKLKSTEGVFTDTTKSIISVSDEREFLSFMKRQINGYTGKPVVFVHENHEEVFRNSISDKLGYAVEKRSERFT